MKIQSYELNFNWLNNKKYQDLKDEIYIDIHKYFKDKNIEVDYLTIIDFEMDFDYTFWVLVEYKDKLLGHTEELEIPLNISLEKFARIFSFGLDN